ncbi:MAG: tRNA uridine-5-carboxymethylaminomethyl(34) synthesis GTPase MnmE [Oscillospiraceae bacterium]|nr:tRNA uridine-5-carboxymethylaminomethyl(34) synthesis GTPase MnmE [Oscillospiraceae bacterium]
MDIIAAISTAPGIGGIGIVRMSGEGSLKILDKMFRAKNKENSDRTKGYSLKYGEIINPETNKVIDEVLVSFFREPKSYTAEEMCEINSHGSAVVLREILDLCLKQGASLAEPGEFTKRAFLNGRIDLSQAEATADMINARTKLESRAAIHQLEGYLSKKINEIRGKAMDVLVDMEANIDYPEYDIEEVTEDRVKSDLGTIKGELEALLKSFEDGKIIKEGIKIAIIGSPNAGKSSLLNAMLKEERAIVTDVAGTTRDTIEEMITIEGIPFNMVDTAGIREADNEVEKIGIEKSKQIAEKSDVIIAMFDNSQELSVEDKEILKFIKGKKAIIVLNKSDLKSANIEEKIGKSYEKIIYISVKEEKGLEELQKYLIAMFKLNEVNLDNENIVTNIRHKKLIEKAAKSAEKAEETINTGMPIDIIAINIKDIIEDLSKITGENVSEDIVNEIFSKFCLGK